MTPQEQREITKLINSHAADINSLVAIVCGLTAELAATHGPDAVDRAKSRALTVAKSMSRPFQPGPDSSKIAAIFEAAKHPA